MKNEYFVKYRIGTDWEEKYRCANEFLVQKARAFLRDQKMIEALREQCRLADAVIQIKNDQLDAAYRKLARIDAEIKELESDQWAGVRAGFLGCLLLTASLAFAYYMLFLRV